MADATSTTTASSKTAQEPDFASLATELAKADTDTRSKSADATEARGKRQLLATATIKAAFVEKIAVNDVTAKLHSAGVLKGTVSKIKTVIEALNEGILTPNDVKSLNGAYAKVKELRKIAYEAAHPTAVKAAAAAAAAGTTGPAKPITPKEAWAIILESIKSDADPFKAGSTWLTKTTNDITKTLKNLENDED